MSIINYMLQDYSDTFVMYHLDDIHIYSQTSRRRIIHIECILQRLRENKLYAKLSRCIFGSGEVEYLGSALKAGKIAMNANKPKAVEAWKTHVNKTEVQSFLSLIKLLQEIHPGPL